MTVLVACDLDGTLIFSRRRAGDGVPDDELVCVERSAAGEISYLSRRALTGLTRLAESAELVAVSARSRAQYARLALPLSRRFAVLANGGILMVDGAPDPNWWLTVARQLSVVAGLDEVRVGLERRGGADWVRRITVVESLFCCVIVDRAAVPEDVLVELAEWADALGWRLSLQGSKLYVVPVTLDKTLAVAEVARRLRADVVIAAGDAALDTGFLRGALCAVHPASGELAETGWSAPGVHQVGAGGALGGEQIVEWLQDRVSDVDAAAAAR